MYVCACMALDWNEGNRRGKKSGAGSVTISILRKLGCRSFTLCRAPLPN